MGLGLELGLDEKGYLQKAKLIKNKKYPKIKASEFEFNLKKVEGLSDFQKKVYSTLIKVPPGKTISYKDLGKKAGYKNAGRAVGTAMSRNEIVFFVPCHRVIRSDGGLGSYSGFGGVKTKKLLLEQEKEKGFLIKA